jgi:hypothetical protein
MTSPEPTCEMDPLTWDALITALKDNGVGDDILDKVCAQALKTINSTTIAERDARYVVQRNA